MDERDPGPVRTLEPVTRPFRIPTPALRPVGILGTGSRLPDRRLANHDLEQLVDTSDEWIVTRTGMRERRIAATEEATSDMAFAAAQRALERAGVAPTEIGLVIVATTTPDHQCCPPTACIVQHRLGATRAAAFDLNAACTGFIEATIAAHGMIAAGTVDKALVIGAEKLSMMVDYTDRETCVLFGDAAGAVVLGADAQRGQMLHSLMGADGSGAELIYVTAGGSRRPTTPETLARREHFLRLDGRKVFRFAVAKIVEVVAELAARQGCEPRDIDVLILHQANLRIIEAAAERLGIDPGRVFVNVDRLGNTSTASVPVALDEAVTTDRIRTGDLVCTVAFGGGLTWGGSLFRW